MTDPHAPGAADNGQPRSTSELSRRIASSAILSVAAILVAWLGGVFFLLFWAAAALVLWWEWAGVIKVAPRAVVLGIGWATLLCCAMALAADIAAIAFICAIIGAGIVMAVAREDRIWAGLGVLYAAALLLPVVLLRADPALGLIAILWLFALVWVEDTAAYFTGRQFGGPRLAPSVSPKKTWSGAIGGTIAGIAAGSIVLFLAGVGGHPMQLVIALIVVVSAQIGDILESAVKRRFAVKDSSSLLPGHGGLMDRLDGFLVASCVTLALGIGFGGVQAPATGLLQW